MATIVPPSTISRWNREDSGTKGKQQPKNGRPRTAEEIEKLILKLAKGPGWGYTRILGELKTLGIESVKRYTEKNIMKRNGPGACIRLLG
ncbi:MAG: hypothetical protein VXZ82_19005 [Planctomycetota bacterium]|nr:hypothetical protein [Planctomycetota bacterium]